MAGQSGSAGAKRAKDAKMAGVMKANGTERTVGKCPICYKLVSIGKPQESIGMMGHISAHARGNI